jgi:hypothetical protein
MGDCFKALIALKSIGTGRVVTSRKNWSDNLTVERHRATWSGCLGFHHRLYLSAILRISPAERFSSS